MIFQSSDAVLPSPSHFWDVKPRTTNTRGAYWWYYQHHLPRKCYDIQDEILIKVLMYVTATRSQMQFNLLEIIKAKRPHK